MHTLSVERLLTIVTPSADILLTATERNTPTLGSMDCKSFLFLETRSYIAQVTRLLAVMQYHSYLHRIFWHRHSVTEHEQQDIEYGYALCRAVCWCNGLP